MNTVKSAIELSIEAEQLYTDNFDFKSTLYLIWFRGTEQISGQSKFNYIVGHRAPEH